MYFLSCARLRGIGKTKKGKKPPTNNKKEDPIPTKTSEVDCVTPIAV